jgi:hypothetical protein
VLLLLHGSQATAVCDEPAVAGLQRRLLLLLLLLLLLPGPCCLSARTCRPAGVPGLLGLVHLLLLLLL